MARARLREIAVDGILSMSFRNLIPLGLAVMVLCACDQQEAREDPGQDSSARDQTFEWKMATTWPKNLPGMGTGVERLAKQVEAMSAGRLKISVYGAGELVPALDVFDAVSGGAAEMGHGAAYYWRGKLPAAAFFTAVPFGMTTSEMNAWLQWGGGVELWREAYEPFDLYPIPAGNTGVQMGGWFNREINSLQDLHGLKMRIPGLAGEVFERAGGTAVILPGGEVFTSLQRGAIDATEWVGPYNDLALGLHEIAQYYYYPGWHEPGAVLEAIVNLDAWKSLPPDLQAIVEAACAALNDSMTSEFAARNSIALKVLVEEHGIELRALPEDVIDRFREISEQLYSEMRERDDLSRRIVDSFLAFREQGMEYQKVSDLAYANIR